MKIVFMVPLINNAFFLEPIMNQLKKNVINTEYEIVVINDAPLPEEKTQLELISILSRRLDCNLEIREECERLGIKHINMPENIHPWRSFPSHGSNRHSELINWFLTNFETLYEDHINVDYICIYDADLFLVKPTDFSVILNNYDIIAPFVKHQNLYHPRVAMMFINIKTVKNYKQMDFRLRGGDTGSGLVPFMNRNRKYKILEAGKIDGYWNDLYETESKFIKKIDVKEGEKCLHYYDVWLEERFVHLRWGWGAGRGEANVNKSLEAYILKIKKVFEIYGIELNFERWINK